MASKERDIYIERNNGTKKGYYLVKRSGQGKSYTKTPIPEQIGGFTDEGTRGTAVGPELEWLNNGWHRGAGYEIYADSLRYAESVGLDPREYQKLMCARLEQSTTGTMADGTKRVFAYWNGAIYCASDDELWELSGTTWTSRGTTTNTITSIVGYKGYLCIGQDSGNFYTWDGGSLTQRGVPRVHLYVERHLLWGSDGNTIYSCEDPSDDSDWDTGTDIAESDSDVQGIRVFNEKLIVGKTDGLYHYRSDGSVRQLWDAAGAVSSDNCRFMEIWRNGLIFSGSGDILMLLTPDDTVLDLSPASWGDYNVGTCLGIASSPDYLIVKFEEDVWIGWLESSGGMTYPRWFRLLTGKDCDGIFWSGDKLFYGDGTGTDYIPFAMKADSTVANRYTGGWLTTSKFDAGFPGRYKVWHGLDYDIPTCPANTTVKFEYSADGGSWTEITTVTATAGIGSANLSAPIKAYQIQLRITMTSTSGAVSPTLSWCKLNGYVVPTTDLQFDMEVLVENCSDGITGQELEEHLFAAATDADPPKFTDPQGTEYYVRFQLGYPQSIIVMDQGERRQYICHVLLWEIRDV